VVVSGLTGYHALWFALYSLRRSSGKDENDILKGSLTKGVAAEKEMVSMKVRSYISKPEHSGAE
jgi:hypothetical protein